MSLLRDLEDLFIFGHDVLFFLSKYFLRVLIIDQGGFSSSFLLVYVFYSYNKLRG